MAKELPPHSADENAKARSEARALLSAAPYAALAYLEPETIRPAIGRISISLIDDTLVTFISDLSAHTMGLEANSTCALMLGEIGKGDGLASPRLSLTATAHAVPDNQREALIAAFLINHPKAKLYASFQDFNFYRFDVEKAAYYGGFGRAHNFSASDLF